MLTIKRYLKTTIKYILFLLGSIQILMGIWYIFENIGYLPENKETLDILQVATSWMVDDHISVFYPCLVWGALKIGDVIPIPYYSLLYVIQLVVAFMAGSVFLKSIFSQEKCKKICIWGSLYFLTFPLVLQSHLSVLTVSLANSLFLICLGFSVKWLRQKRKLSIAQGLTLFIGVFLLIITSKTYILALIGVIVVLVFRSICTKNKKIILLIGVLCIGFSAGWSVNQITQVPYKQDKAVNSIAINTFKRTMWPYLHSDYSFWPGNAQKLFTEKEVRIYTTNVEYIDTEIGFKIEQALGQVEAQKFYWNMSINSIDVRTKELGATLIEDFIYNSVPILGVWLERYGDGVGGNNYNFMRFQWNEPFLANCYMKFSIFSWFVSVGGALLLFVFVNESFSTIKKYKNEIGIVAVSTVMQILYGTWIGSTRMDYFNVVFVVQMLLFIVLGSLMVINKEAKEGE